MVAVNGYTLVRAAGICSIHAMQLRAFFFLAEGILTECASEGEGDCLLGPGGFRRCEKVTRTHWFPSLPIFWHTY